MPDALRRRFTLWATLPVFRQRVARAQARCARWLARCERPYIAYSTGKDSTCVLHLVRQQAPETPAVFFDAACSFPESLALVERAARCISFPADEPLLDTLARYGILDERAGAEIVRNVVDRPIKRLLTIYAFDGVALGLRSEESRGRQWNARQRGALYRVGAGLWHCQPIFDWSYNDVWAYIVGEALPYCATYDKLWDAPEADQRLSYWAGDTKIRWGRWAWLRRNYPDLFNRFAARFPEARAYV